MCNKCNDCNDCNPCNPCKCENRYQGPDIPQVGITTGMTYDEVLEILSSYTSDVNFEDGVGIESEGYNPLTGVLTLNFTDGTSYSTGDLRGPQGPAGADGVDGAAGPNQLVIQNTLIVSKNGNDSTGTRNDWAKPFLTISAAGALAQAGDLVVVFPGTYNESNVAESDIHYYYHKGAIVNSGFGTCIMDSVGQPKNIFIYGEGTFKATSGRGVFLNDPGTNATIHFDHIEGFDGILIGDSNKLNIKGRSTRAITQYTVSIRGNSSGIIDIDTYDGSTSINKGQTILIRNASLDLVERQLVIKGRYLKSNCEFLQGAITTENCDTLSVILDIDYIDHITTSDLITTAAIWHQSGKLKVRGSITSKENKGIVLSNSGGDTILLLDSCQVTAKNLAFSTLNGTTNLYAELVNSQITKTGNNSVAAVTLGTTAGPVEVSFSNSTVTNRSNSYAVEILDTNSILRVDDVKVEVNSISGPSIYCPIARTIFVESVLMSNRAIDANITNGVTGSTIIIDTNIKRNTKVFN